MKPNLSSTAFFFGAAIIMLLVAIILVIGNTFDRSEVAFGTCKLTAEVARTSEEKARGLSGRPAIGQNEAMIFPFNNEQPSFWMKDMLFPIDIVWVNNNQVVKIDANLPLDNGATSYSPGQPIDWVVEVAAGRSAACGVTPGTTITGLRT